MQTQLIAEATPNVAYKSLHHVDWKLNAMQKQNPSLAVILFVVHFIYWKDIFKSKHIVAELCFKGELDCSMEKKDLKSDEGQEGKNNDPNFPFVTGL